MEQPDEVVCQIGAIIPRIQLFSQGKERLRVVMEIVNLKYGLGIGEVILLKVVIKATSGGSVRRNRKLEAMVCWGIELPL